MPVGIDEPGMGKLTAEAPAAYPVTGGMFGCIEGMLVVADGIALGIEKPAGVAEELVLAGGMDILAMEAAVFPGAEVDA